MNREYFAVREVKVSRSVFEELLSNVKKNMIKEEREKLRGKKYVTDLSL